MEGLIILIYLLLIISILVFYIFFKQLFSENYYKRKVDLNVNPENNFSDSKNSNPNLNLKLNRIEELRTITKELINKADYNEAYKAISSALILESDNINLLLFKGFILVKLTKLKEAKQVYEKIILLDKNNDISHSALANIYSNLEENQLAIKHYQKAIEIDSEYSSYYSEYADFLYKIGKKDLSLENYKIAYKLDTSLTSVKKKIEEISKIK